MEVDGRKIWSLISGNFCYIVKSDMWFFVCCHTTLKLELIVVEAVAPS